jgi:hypothetical protein
MKKLFLTMTTLVLASTAMWGGTICPAGSGSNPFPHNPDNAATGCNAVITVAANGGITITVPDGTPYENSEDVLVGVKNNSASTIGSLNLSGGTGSGIFGFDGDGICTFTFVGSTYCNSSQLAGTDPADYQGPTSTFSNFSSNPDKGTVSFNPVIAANGGSSYFSLEGTPSTSLAATVGSTGPTTPVAGAPALSTWAMVLLTIMLVGLSTRMLKRAA